MTETTVPSAHRRARRRRPAPSRLLGRHPSDGPHERARYHRRWAQAQRAGLGGAVVALTLLALSLPGGLPLGALARDLVLYNVVLAGAALATAARAARDPAPWPWVALTGALVVTVAANLHFTLVLSGAEVVYPSWADAGYLASYPLTYVAVVGLVRSRAAHWHASVWLDGLMVGLCSAALGAAFVLSPVLEVSGAALPVVVTNLAYPLGDLLLLSTAAAGLVLLGRRADATLAVLGLGVLVNGVADAVYLLQGSAGTYVEGSALDLLWCLGAVLYGAATFVPSRASGPGPATAGGVRWLLAVPGVVTAVSAALMVPLQEWSAPAVAQWLAGGAVVVAAVRASLSYREVRQLADARQQAVTDDLTGLSNRRGLAGRADELLGTPAQGQARRTALLLLDLDRFKEVNDSLGHQAGDQLLVAVAGRVAAVLRGPDDVLARLGGDEFALLLPGADVGEARRVAERVTTALAEPLELHGMQLRASGSTGIAVSPDHGATLALLMRRADIAMYRAKAEGSGHAVYDPSRNDDAAEVRLQRAAELRQALAEGRLVLHYQPRVDLPGGAVTGVEALVRWDHRNRGLLLPAEFLATAHESGLLPALTDHVLDRALAQLTEWRESGLDLTVAVNLPPAAVVDALLPDRVAVLLDRHRLPAHRLALEITENSLLADRTRARDVLRRLRATGVRIAVDDFGSGWSSLAYLSELPLDELKLDRAFVQRMGQDDRAAAIVRSTVALARSLGLHFVAEGVEDAATAEALARCGCDSAQGFFYSAALPPSELPRWLAAHRAAGGAPG